MELNLYDHHGFQPKNTLAYNFAIKCNSHTGIFSQQITGIFFLSKFRRSQRQRITSLLYKSGTNDSDHKLGPTLLRGGGTRGDRGRDVPLPQILVFSIKSKTYSFKSICIPLPPFTFLDLPPDLFLLYGLVFPSSPFTQLQASNENLRLKKGAKIQIV